MTKKRLINNQENLLKIAILLLFIIPDLHNCQTQEHKLTQNSTLTIKNLKKSTPKSFTKETLITYKVEELFKKSQQNSVSSDPYLTSSLTSIYVLERLQKLRNLRKFSISFSLGGLPASPGFGSMFKVTLKDKKDRENLEEQVKELSYILGGWVGYSGINLFQKRKLFYSFGDEVVYWDGLTTEILCIHHMEKIRKILRPERLSNINYLFSNEIFDQKYSKFQLDFEFLDTPDAKIRDYKIMFKLETLYQTRKLSKIFENLFYTSLDSCIFEVINEGENKSFLSKRELTREMNNKKSYKVLEKEGLKSLGTIKLRKPLITVHRKELGKTSTPGRRIVNWLQNNSKRDAEVILTLPFSSHHDVFINTLKVFDISNQNDIEFTFDFQEFKDRRLVYLKSPLQINLKFRIKGSSKVRISMEYNVHFIDLNVLDPEDDRGMYIPPSLVFFKFLGEEVKEENYELEEQNCNLNGPNGYCVAEMETLLTRLLGFDNTSAFTALTLGILTSAFLYSTFASWGVSDFFK